jgi:hypothetical protein
MAKPFGGTINVDIRDSKPDWARFEPPKAPDGAPNVLYIVLDDVGYSGYELLRRADRNPEHRPDRRGRRALHAVPHDCAVLADLLVLAHRSQPHAQQHGLHHRGRDRVSDRERHGSGGERHAGGDPRRGRVEHVHGRQVASVSDGRDESRLDPAQLAQRPRVRALVRVPRRGDQPVVSGPGLRQPHRRPAAVSRRGAITSPTTSPTRPSSSSETRRRSHPRNRSAFTTRRAPVTRRITRRRNGSRSSRAVSIRATRRSVRRLSPARRRSGWCRPTPSCRRSTRSGRPRPAPVRTGNSSPSSTTRDPGIP